MHDETVLGTPSSGNIFADLGFENPEQMLDAATLINGIEWAIKHRGLEDAKAAEIIGISPKSLFDLRNGRDEGHFDVGRLAKMLLRIAGDPGELLAALQEQVPSQNVRRSCSVGELTEIEVAMILAAEIAPDHAYDLEDLPAMEASPRASD